MRLLRRKLLTWFSQRSSQRNDFTGASASVDSLAERRHDANAVELGLVRLVLNCIAAAFLVSRFAYCRLGRHPQDDPAVKLPGRRLKPSRSVAWCIKL